MGILCAWNNCADPRTRVMLPRSVYHYVHIMASCVLEVECSRGLVVGWEEGRVPRVPCSFGTRKALCSTMGCH